MHRVAKVVTSNIEGSLARRFTTVNLSNEENAIENRLVNAKKVADILDCSLRHVWRLASTEILPRIRIGGLVRFRQSDVENLMKGSHDDKRHK